MAKIRPTIVTEKDGQKYKLFKTWFGPDGTYYVTVPYHIAKTASLLKRTVRYDTPFGKMIVSSDEDIVDVAILDDDDGRLKLSHHPDGFCQFSGEGILSGKDESGRINGIGVFARALRAIGPKFGPVFSVTVWGIEKFDVCPELGHDDILFQIDRLAPAVALAIPSEPDAKEPAVRFSETEGLSIEGFYFQPEYRRFVHRDRDGGMRILMPHPTGIVIPLAVVSAPAECDLPGFIGLYACRVMVRFEATSGFSIAGPAENYREDAWGRRLGDVINCHYPRISFVEGRSINYPADST